MLHIYYPYDIVFSLCECNDMMTWQDDICVWQYDMTIRHDDMTWHNDIRMTDWHDMMTYDGWGGVGAETIREILD